MITPILESAIAGQISKYLDLKRDAGVLTWDRQNAGSIPRKRNLRLCRPGTADFIVLQGYRVITIDPREEDYLYCRVIYLEVKTPVGIQSDDQKKFQADVEAQGAEYYIVRSLEEVVEIVEGK